MGPGEAGGLSSDRSLVASQIVRRGDIGCPIIGAEIRISGVSPSVGVFDSDELELRPDKNNILERKILEI